VTPRPGSPASSPVLLHGFTGSSASWGDALLDGLAAGGHAPVLVDLPGHGRHAGEAGPSAFTLEAALDSVLTAGDWPADLVGYSMGARIALHFAVAHPDLVRRLVLESGSPGLSDEQERTARREADERLASEIVRDGIERFVAAWETRPLFESRVQLSDETRGRQRALRLLNAPESLAAALRGLGTGALPSLWDRLHSIATPTLLVVGGLDTKFVRIAQRMAAALPDARVAVVSDAGHTVHLERPADWAAVVGGFLGA
jgi:2-succinyl-6-hydroxy-2,4-cyclohexadiene-1-carboxylate synthase